MKLWATVLGAFWLGYFWCYLTEGPDDTPFLPIITTVGTIIYLVVKGLMS